MSQKISAREELRASQSRLSLALTAGRSGIFEWESRSDVNVWSHELLSLYGLESAEFDGTLEAWVQCLVPEDQEAGRAALQRSFETGLFELEFRIRRRDNGEIRWMYGRANVLFDDRGKPAQMLGINVDIT